MDTTIDQQVAMDEALVPHAHRLRIERSNFCLLSDIKSKESTLQLVYDVLRLTPFFKAFLVIVDVLEIYMQEFWATATVHQHSIRFKMDNKKHIVNLESFREMLHICPRLPHQPFVEPPFEEEIRAFLRFLGHSGAIRRLTDVNINKLHQPWRSFAAIINKCLTEKSSGYDSLRLSQAQILWGLYHKRNVDFASLMWVDFVYQVEHKDTKKSKEMYYPRFTKVIIHHFMLKDPSIPRRNKVNWHYVRDDHMFTTIKLVSRHQNTQQFGALLPIELTNEDIKNSNAYKEYYAFSTGATPPKPKANEGTGFIPWVPDVPADDSEEEISWNSTDEEGDDDEGYDGDGDDEGNDGDDETRDEESFDPIPKTPENTDDKGNGEENLGINVGREEGHDEEEEEDELYRDININQGRGIQTTQEFKDSHVTLTPVNPDGQQQSSSVSSQFVTSMLNPTPDAEMKSIFETTSQMDVQIPTSMAPFPMFAPTLTPSTIATITTTQQAPIPLTTALSTLLQDLPNFGSLFVFDNRLKTLKENFFEFMQTNQFAGAIKEQVKVQVSKILPKIEQTVNEQLEAKVLTRSSNSSKTSYVVAADLSEMELKKILIEKMKGNKSFHRSNEQRNFKRPTSYVVAADLSEMELKKILIEKMKGNKQVTLKRRRDDDAGKDEEHSVGPDRGSKRRREGKESVSASAPKEKATRSAGKSTQESKSRQTSGSCKSLVELKFFLEEVYKATTDQLDWVNPEGQQYPHNLLKPLPMIPNNRGLRVIPFDHFINNDLEYLRGGASSHKYTTSATKIKAADYGHIKWIKTRIIAVTELKIVEWHNYKHLDWITVRRDDDKLYKFKEGDFKRLRIRDIEDMLLLLVQGNLTVEERFAFNVSL
nr:hypothetical protein [Tanacetum cinerariifolium]